SQNSILYGAKWDSATQEQLEMFGNSVEYLDYVECTANNCEHIEGYPTWMIGNREEQGLQSIKRLQKLTGCE
ncbi:hypothetical protein ACFL1B_01690, partial [Nanoarchaeota archaeon]